MKLNDNYQIIAAFTAIILAGSFITVNAFSGEDYSEVYSQTSNQISPVGAQLSEDTYRFSEINNSMIYGPYQINETGYFIREGKAYDGSLKRAPAKDEDVKALHDFYLKTYLDPIFYANKEGERQKLEEFEKFESTKLLADKCGLEYNLIPQDYFSALDKNQELTDDFFKKPSKSMAEELNRQNVKTASEYAGMAGNFADLLQKNLSQNECFNETSDDVSGMALATNTPVQYRIDNDVFSDYISMANQNAKKIQNQTDERKEVLNGRSDVNLEPDVDQKSFEIQYNDENIYSSEQALEEMNQRRIAEDEEIKKEEETEEDNQSQEYAEEEPQEGESTETSNQEDVGSGIEAAYETLENVTPDEFRWELKDAYLSEGVLEYEFAYQNSTAQVELSQEGKIAEIIINNTALETKDNSDINKTQAFEIASSEIDRDLYPEWVSYSNATSDEGEKFEFEFKSAEGELEANIDVNKNGVVEYTEMVLIPEDVLESEGSGEEKEEGSEDPSNRFNETEKEELGLVDSEPRKYHLKDYMRPNEGLKPVYGWDKNIYPNIISAERNLLTVNSENLESKDYYTVCRGPYVELTRLDWYVTDGLYNEVSNETVYQSGKNAETESEFLKNPGENTLNNLSNLYEKDLYTHIDEGKFSEDIPTIWKRQNKHQSKLHRMPDTYDDFYNENHMEIWSYYFQVDVGPSDKLNRNEYNYFVATESLYPLLFMTNSDSVWRLEEKPDKFSGKIGQSGVGLPAITF